MAVGAIIDRLLHHAQVIAINDKSNRVKEAPVVTRENKKGRKPNEAATGGPQLVYSANTTVRPRWASFASDSVKTTSGNSGCVYSLWSIL
jgi:hypothetical protein